MSWVSAAIGLVGVGTGVYKAVKSSNAEKRDRKALEDARKARPEYVIPEAFEENKAITGNLAGQGLTSAAKDFYQSLVQGGLSSSIGAMQQAGGGVNSLNELLQSYNDSVAKTAAMDSQMKTANIGEFINANSALAGQQLIKKFGIPNQRSQNDIASLNNSIWQDQAGFNSGISDITGAAAAFVASGASGKMGDNIYNNRMQKIAGLERKATNTINNAITNNWGYAPIDNSDLLKPPM